MRCRPVGSWTTKPVRQSSNLTYKLHHYTECFRHGEEQERWLRHESSRAHASPNLVASSTQYHRWRNQSNGCDWQLRSPRFSQHNNSSTVKEIARSRDCTLQVGIVLEITTRDFSRSHDLFARFSSMSRRPADRRILKPRSISA